MKCSTFAVLSFAESRARERANAYEMRVIIKIGAWNEYSNALQIEYM